MAALAGGDYASSENDLSEGLDRLTVCGKKLLLKEILKYKGKTKDVKNEDLKQIIMSFKKDSSILIELDDKLKKEDKGKYIRDGRQLRGEYRGIRDWNNFITKLRSKASSSRSFSTPTKNKPTSVFTPGSDVTGPFFLPSAEKQNTDYGHDPETTLGVTNRVILEGMANEMDSQMSPSLIGEELDGLYSPTQDPESIQNYIADLDFDSDDDMQDRDDSLDDMEIPYDGNITSPSGGQLCPACISGLCDTHIRLRF